MRSSLPGLRFSGRAVFAASALLLIWLRAPDGAAAQAREYLGCVTPKATPGRATHALRRRWIFVFTKPSTGATTLSYTIASPLPLWIIGKSDGFYKVATGRSMNEWPFKPEAVLGWVRTSDVQDQAIRNCT